jgi:hypothetical protein
MQSNAEGANRETMRGGGGEKPQFLRDEQDEA